MASEVETTKAPEIGEKTQAQQPRLSFLGLVSTAGLGLDYRQGLASYDAYRQISRHPTVALALNMAIATITAANWSVEADDDADDEWVQFIRSTVMPKRDAFVKAAMRGCYRFGWQGFEKVFEVDSDGMIVLEKLKPLLQDITEIQTLPTGQFQGFKQDDVVLPLENSLLIPFQVEGTQWYGEPLLENIRETWQQWRDANAGAARYDRKLAGSHWVVYYPSGSSTDVNGTLKDNAEIAAQLLATLESSGSIAVPQDIAGFVDQLNAGASPADLRKWIIEIKEDSGGRQPTFIERLKYLDSLMVRGILWPERTMTEGQFGTKADAGAHQDLAVTIRDSEHRELARLFNCHVVDQLLVINFGQDAEGKVRVKPEPLIDDLRVFLQEIYKLILANPSGFLEEFGMIDTDAMKDVLGVPKSQEVAQAGDHAVPIEGVDTNSQSNDAVRKLMEQINASLEAHGKPVGTGGAA